MNNILSTLQHASQTWEHLLATTGGKLVIPKCAVYILKWVFDAQGIPSLDKACTAKISVSSSETSEQTTIPHLPNDIPFKYLRVNTTPIGDQQCQLRETIHIAKGVREYSQQIRLPITKLVYMLIHISTTSHIIHCLRFHSQVNNMIFP